MNVSSNQRGFLPLFPFRLHTFQDSLHPFPPPQKNIFNFRQIHRKIWLPHSCVCLWYLGKRLLRLNIEKSGFSFAFFFLTERMKIIQAPSSPLLVLQALLQAAGSEKRGEVNMKNFWPMKSSSFPRNQLTGVSLAREEMRWKKLSTLVHKPSFIEFIALTHIDALSFGEIQLRFTSTPISVVVWPRLKTLSFFQQQNCFFYALKFALIFLWLAWLTYGAN